MTQGTSIRSVVLVGLLTAIVLGSTSCNEPGCIRIEHPPVTDPETPLLIGGTYGEALDIIVGSRSGPMQWREVEPPIDIDGLPPPSETRLTVTVHEPSMAEQIEYERGRIARNERLICNSPTLFAELELELRSDDGLLDTIVPASTTIRSPINASVTARLDDQELGDLELMPMESGTDLWLQIFYTAGDEANGTMTLGWSSSDGDGSGAGWSDELATWTLEAQ